VADRLPLFPLGSVVVPGQVLPLHVFEPRYRSLVQDLQALPEGAREFGVVAIRAGREVGEDGVVALHEVGTVVRLHRVSPYPDGRYDVVGVGTGRFRVRDVAHDRPYLVGLVDRLADDPGDADEAALLAASTTDALTTYLRALGAAAGGETEVPDLPDEPRALSYVVAAGTRIDLDDRQALLEVPDDAGRLRAALGLLRREVRLMRALRAVPAPELARVPLSPN
jgi:uncharacterized protein